MFKHKNSLMFYPGLFAMAALVADPLRAPDITAEDQEVPEPEEALNVAPVSRERHNRIAASFNDGARYLPHQGKREQARRARKLLKLSKKRLELVKRGIQS